MGHDLLHSRVLMFELFGVAGHHLAVVVSPAVPGRLGDLNQGGRRPRRSSCHRQGGFSPSATLWITSDGCRITSSALSSLLHPGYRTLASRNSFQGPVGRTAI